MNGESPSRYLPRQRPVKFFTVMTAGTIGHWRSAALLQLPRKGTRFFWAQRRGERHVFQDSKDDIHDIALTGLLVDGRQPECDAIFFQFPVAVFSNRWIFLQDAKKDAYSDRPGYPVPVRNKSR